MAISDLVNVGGTTNSLLTIAILLGILLLAAAIGGVVYFVIRQYKRYSQFNVVIWEKDGFGQMREVHDTGGVFIDKVTGAKRLYLKKMRVGLDCNNIPYIPLGKNKKIYLLRSGSKNFRFIKPEINDNQIRFTISEEDVNWAAYDYEKLKKLFEKKDWMQWLPYISLIVVAVIIMIIFVYFFKNFDVLKDVAEQFRATAAANAETTQALLELYGRNTPAPLTPLSGMVTNGSVIG